MPSCVCPEKAMAPHSSTLAWKIPWMEEPGRLQSMGSLRVGHNWATSLSRIGEGNGNPLQCSCLENPRDGGACCAAISGVAQSRTRLKQLSSSSSSSSSCVCHMLDLFWFFFMPRGLPTQLISWKVAGSEGRLSKLGALLRKPVLWNSSWKGSTGNEGDLRDGLLKCCQWF